MDFLAVLAVFAAFVSSVSFAFSALALSLPWVPRELSEPWLPPRLLAWLPLRVLAANADENLLQWLGKTRSISLLPYPAALLV